MRAPHGRALRYRELLESYPAAPMSQLYGCEHLLRLLVKLPELLDSGAVEALPAEVVFIFNAHLASLLKYMAHRAPELLGGYENATPEYLRQP